MKRMSKARAAIALSALAAAAACSEQFPNKIENGIVTIQAGQLPTPGSSVALAGQRRKCV